MWDCDHLRVLRLVIATLLLLGLLLPQQISAQTDSNTSVNQQVQTTAGNDQPAIDALSILEQQFLDDRIEQYLNQMSTADKVGQLFVVSFQGDNISVESDIAELIYLYRIGGVALSPRYSNFNNSKNSDTPTEVATLVNLLQSLAYGVSLEHSSALDPAVLTELSGHEWPAGILRSRSLEEGVENVNPPNLPLFIAVEQNGNGIPGTSLVRGFTQLPSQMAIGSTWEPERALEVGKIIGRELRAVGVNMLLGPDLNVFTQPSAEQVGQLGIRSFGRSPFWVSQMSKAYIEGIHQGSNNQLITIARHFPGQGSSDRLPNQEIATIQETIEELNATHFAPFVSVTRSSSSVAQTFGDPSMTDGLMSSHMRYGNLQGGSDTKPLSLVPRLGELLQDEKGKFTTWRQRGILMSDELGAPAIRQYYESTGESFPILDVALSAFDAGHDLLYISRFSADDTWEAEKENTIQTIEHFQQRYNDDSDFAAKVDTSVRRILRLKLQIHTLSPTELLQARINAVEANSTEVITTTEPVGRTGLTSPLAVEAANAITVTQPLSLTVAPELENTYHISLTRAISLSTILAVSDDLEILDISDDLEILGTTHRDEANAIIAEVVQDSLTLLYPNTTEDLPQPPQRDEKVLIITDSRIVKECESCIADAVGPDSLKEKIIELYGPDGRNLVDKEQFTTLGFSDLAEYLDKKAETELETAEADDEESAVADVIPTVEDQREVTQEAATDGDSTEEGTVESSTNEAKVLQRMEERFDESDWVIFVMLDIVEEVPSSNVVKRFLGTDGERLRNVDKKTVVLALNAPYFLDATEVSQLSAYFGVNSSTDLFIENAVDGLFQSDTPRGAPVYDVPGTIYANLSDRLKPDPETVIPLQIYAGEYLIGQVPPIGDEPEPVVIQNGQAVRLQVGPVIDKNGHIVPDGTIVEFIAENDAGDSILSPDPATTRNGQASRTVQFDRDGRLQISASSELAASGILEVFVEAAAEPEVLPTPTDVSTVVPTPTETPPTAAAPVMVSAPSILTLIVALLTILVMLSLLLILQIRVLPRPYLVQNMLWAMIVGLFSYILYSAYLLYSKIEMTLQVNLFATAIVVFISMLIPLLWLQLREE